MTTQAQCGAQTARRALGEQNGVDVGLSRRAAGQPQGNARADAGRCDLPHRCPGLERRTGGDRRLNQPIVEFAPLDDRTPRRCRRPTAGDRDAAGRAHRSGREREPIAEVDPELRCDTDAIGRDPIATGLGARPRAALDEPDRRAAARKRNRGGPTGRARTDDEYTHVHRFRNTRAISRARFHARTDSCSIGPTVAAYVRPWRAIVRGPGRPAARREPPGPR